MAGVPAALRSLLGKDVYALDETRLRLLIGLEESDWIEFKREVPDDKGARHELALDVTSFANASGGLLVIGVGEDGLTGTAVELSGVPVGGDLALRIEQVLGAKIQPPLPVSVVRVPLAADREVVIVAVEAGPLAPHAVMDGTSRLLYPVRRGREKAYLSEAQVADAYGRRFLSADRRAGDLSDLHREHADALSLEHQAWVVATLQPAGVGFSGLGPMSAQQCRDWLRDSSSWPQLSMPNERRFLNVRIGYRGFRVADDFSTPGCSALLRTDGSGSAAYSWLVRSRLQRDADGALPDGDDSFVGSRNAAFFVTAIFNLLALLTAHAHRMGAHGTADVALQIIAADNTSTSIPPDGLAANDIRLLGALDERAGSSRTSVRTIDLGALPHDPTYLLQVVHLVTVDLISEFGLPDTGVTTADGAVVTSAANFANPALVQWARRVGVATVD